MIPINELSAIFPGDGRYWKITNSLSEYTSEEALINTRIEIEAQYLIALSKAGVIREITSEEESFLNSFYFSSDHCNAERVKEIEQTTRHDVKAIEKFFAEVLCGSSMEDLVCKVHILLTSEDVNNLAYRIMYSRALSNIYIPALTKLLNLLTELADDWKNIPMLGRTHGQAAIPTTVGKEIINFAVRINDCIVKLKKVKLNGKLNGAIGNYNSFSFVYPNIDWLKFSEDFVASNWDFRIDHFTTQINPFDDLVESFQVLQRINNIMIGFNQDIWRYISDYWIAQVKKDGEIGSSVMTQKINPIYYENGEGNYKFSNGIWEVMVRELQISRLQRDLVNSTEIRNVGVGLAYGLIAVTNTIEGLGRIYPNMIKISEDLNENWNILGEVVQSVLRANNIPDAYSIVEKFTKGQKLDRVEYLLRVDNLPLDNETKARLKTLTPSSYIGKAVELTDMAIKQIYSGE